MDNYAVALDRAREAFLRYDRQKLLDRKGVVLEGKFLTFPFAGAKTIVDLETGTVRFSYPDGTSWEGGFGEGLSVYDWLCDGQEDAAASGEFCPVYSLLGVYVGGNGLMLKNDTLSQMADRDPDRFRWACRFLGGEPWPAGDIGFRIPLFCDLSAVLKFYHSDEEFPAQLTLLWDRNTLRFVRYETVYYIAGVLMSRLKTLMGRHSAQK